MPLTNRPVEPEDLAIIRGFPRSETELFYMFPKATYPLTEGQLQAAIDQRSDSTVVELDGLVVGFANYYHWATGGSCHIGNVIVAPDARGRGVGRYIVETMIDLAFAKHQAAEVQVSCFNHNTAGLLLYPKLGFKPFAVEERIDKQGHRVAVVQFRLLRANL